jgi:hypothetical protein
MQLLTKEIIAKLPPLYSTEGNGEAPVIVKFFFPGPGTWYITEGRKEENGDWLFFGLCDLGEPELGYVRLSDLKSVKVNGLGIERDLHFHGYVLDYGTNEVRHASGDVEHPPKSSPAGEPPERESWEMTREEYGVWTSEDVDRIFAHPDDVLRAGLKALGFRDRITGSVRDVAEYYYTSGNFVYSHEGKEAYKDAMHRAAVEYAMRKEGKAVHAVIAGYPDFSKPEDPEAELRAMWTAKGIPEERQNEILAEVAAKAQPGAQVGPFRIREKPIAAVAATAAAAEAAARKAHEKGTCDAHCQLCYAEVFAGMSAKTTIQ